MNNKQIAIDGPAGAGKSSISKIIAKKLGFIYIDTGAMYRALTYQALKNNLNLNDEIALVNLLLKTKITFIIDKKTEKQKVLCNEIDVTEQIRMPEVNQKVSLVATKEKVREVMVTRQKDLAKSNNVVMDGRDIGTVVLPNAQFKIFLTASLDERVKRRALELESKGFNVNREKLATEISLRDEMDKNRPVSPLKVAEDAIIIDTSNLNIEEVTNKILNLVKI